MKASRRELGRRLDRPTGGCDTTCIIAYQRAQPEMDGVREQPSFESSAEVFAPCKTVGPTADVNLPTLAPLLRLDWMKRQIRVGYVLISKYSIAWSE